MNESEIVVDRRDLLEIVAFIDQLEARGVDSINKIKLIRKDGSGIGYTLEAEVSAKFQGLPIRILGEIVSTENW